jgi:hypothetical protein
MPVTASRPIPAPPIVACAMFMENLNCQLIAQGY